MARSPKEGPPMHPDYTVIKAARDVQVGDHLAMVRRTERGGTRPYWTVGPRVESVTRFATDPLTPSLRGKGGSVVRYHIGTDEAGLYDLPEDHPVPVYVGNVEGDDRQSLF